MAVFFRALGGPPGARIAARSASVSSHRLTLRQRLGFGRTENLQVATFDGEVLALPDAFAFFADRRLNEKLYAWLAAFFANAASVDRADAGDRLHSDVLMLRHALEASRRVLAQWPGLRDDYSALREGVRAGRPERRLPAWEAAVERSILYFLGGEAPQDPAARRIVEAVAGSDVALSGLEAPADYHRFLPVPVWGETVCRGFSPSTGDRDDEAGPAAASADDRRRPARRRQGAFAAQKDALLLNRFEFLLSIAEMLNINRSVEDDDPTAAREAAEAVDEVALSDHPQTTTSRLKLDLELAPRAVDLTPVVAEFAYPEWDYRRRTYHPDHCRIVAAEAPEDGEDWQPDALARRQIRTIRRQFEALRPRRRLLPAQADGEDVDLAALVRNYADLRADQPGSERVFVQARSVERDLSVALLVDVSLSTDSWIDNRRVLDVEKHSVLALMAGLSACGDEHAVFTFTSRQRQRVTVDTVKNFDEPLTSRVYRRVQALKPGHYTRIGAALRHVTARLVERPQRHRLLLLITDGKPNDMDHYEGRYGVEDTRRAVQEARRSGLAVFGITVDRKAREYFPYLFGRGGFAIVKRIGKLPSALPAIYCHITR